MSKRKLYLIQRYYDTPAEVLVVAVDKGEAKELSNRKYGSNEGQIAKRVKFDKSKVLHIN